MRYLLASANLGGIDPFYALPRKHSMSLVEEDMWPVDERALAAVYYTDRSEAPPAGSVPDWWWVSGWAVRRAETTDDPRLAAKRYKCQLHRTVPEVESWRPDRLLWADASFKFHSLDFLLQDFGHRAAFVPHPVRRYVGEEYEYVLQMLKAGNKYLCSRYQAGPLEAERDHFARSHDLFKLPLYCGGLWSLPNDERSHRFLDSWWRTVNVYSVLDQASLPPLLVEAGIEVQELPFNIYRSEHYERVSHE